MKTINLNRLLSLLLSLVMVFSVIYIASPSAYADDPIITPQLFEGGETIDVDSCVVTWVRGVTDEFKNGSHVIAATVENYPAEALSKPKNHYLVGKITVYLDKLPTESDMTSNGILPSVKIKLPIKDDKVNWNGYDEQGTIAIKFNTTAGTEASFSNAYIVTPVGAQLYSSYCLTCKIDKTTYYYDYIIQVKDKNANIIALELNDYLLKRKCEQIPCLFMYAIK